jgi:hypothetical protein
MTAATSVPTHSYGTRLDLFEDFAGPCSFLQDCIGLGGPLEGFGFGVAVGDPGFDGSHEVVDALEHAAADLLARDLREQPLDEVQPG